MCVAEQTFRTLASKLQLPEPLRKDAPLNASIEATFYVPGATGYTDYPALVA